MNKILSKLNYYGRWGKVENGQIARLSVTG
jgi:hypothetical protein